MSQIDKLLMTCVTLSNVQKFKWLKKVIALTFSDFTTGSTIERIERENDGERKEVTSLIGMYTRADNVSV